MQFSGCRWQVWFRCAKIRKAKYACLSWFRSDVYVLNVPSLAHQDLCCRPWQHNTVSEQAY